MSSDARATPEGGGEIRVTDNQAERCYEAHIGRDLVGTTTYHLQSGLLTLLHTEVEPAFEGQGVGSRLVAAVLDDARERDLAVLPVCPFVRTYLQRHPQPGLRLVG